MILQLKYLLPMTVRECQIKHVEGAGKMFILMFINVIKKNDKVEGTKDEVKWLKGLAASIFKC